MRSGWTGGANPPLPPVPAGAVSANHPVCAAGRAGTAIGETTGCIRPPPARRDTGPVQPGPCRARCQPSPWDGPRAEPSSASLRAWHAGWARAAVHREHTRCQAGLDTVEWWSVTDPGQPFNDVQWDLYPLDVGGASPAVRRPLWETWMQILTAARHVPAGLSTAPLCTRGSGNAPVLLSLRSDTGFRRGFVSGVDWPAALQPFVVPIKGAAPSPALSRLPNAGSAMSSPFLPDRTGPLAARSPACTMSGNCR